MTDNRDWIPVRNGDTYCSPACGRGCTYSEYEFAVEKAKEISKLIGWHPSVHENLGWHYKSVSTSGNYTMYTDNGEYECFNQYIFRSGWYSNPIDALNETKRQIKEYIKNLEDRLKE